MKKTPLSVVTGAAGFLGSHLTDLLLARGHKVIGIDNFITGTVDNIAHLGGNPSFKFILQDVTEFVFLNEPVNYVWHFASPASPFDYLNFPIQTLKVGSLGTHKTLGLAKIQKRPLPARIHLGNLRRPAGASANRKLLGQCQPRRPARLLRRGQTLCRGHDNGLSPRTQLQTRIARIFNTYGPRMRLNDGRVVPSFISQALKNKPVTVFGKGRQTRCFCYVSDLIEGIYRLMMSHYDLPVNIGNPDEMTVLEFAREIIRATGSRSKIIFKPLPQDDPKRRRPDIARAIKILRWQPKVPLDRGLRETIAYFKRKV